MEETEMKKTEDAREVPSYGFTEVAQYLRLPVATLRSWFLGQAGFKPLIQIAFKNPNTLSFFNMIEAHVLAALRRKHKLTMPRIRKALDCLGTFHDYAHPLAEKWFETDGVNLFVDELGKLVNLSQNGQQAMREVLCQHLNRIDRDEKAMPIRLYPFTSRQTIEETRVVVIDPRIAFGQPVIAGTGIRTSIIAERFEAGESIEELVAEYGRTAREIEEAIRSEFPRTAAA